MSVRFTYILLLLCGVCFANNVQLSQLELKENNILKYQLSWENSWNYTDSIPPFNHDAIWIFCKGKRISDGNWETIHFASTGHAIDSDFEIMVAANGIGKMVKRRHNGEGNVDIAIESVVSVFNISALYSEIRIFGIEMVEVSDGAFYVGDSVSNNTLMEYESGLPFLIDNELLVNVGESGNQIWVNGDFPPGGNIPGQYPKGFNGFYGMKYEISQQQYADFLNTLTSTQKLNRTLNTSVESLCFLPTDHIEGERNFITEIEAVFGCDANDNSVFGDLNDGQNVACNFLTWADLTAYLDWSGLRPMTELEFEKACRGSLNSVPLEFAWGNPNIVNTDNPFLSAQPNESVGAFIPAGSGIGNYGYCNPSGPLRTGFAAKTNTDRIESGASYFGMMEMSGNLWEMCISLSEEGLKFRGNHGDGSLDEDGFANEVFWDAILGDASGVKGGGWNSGILPGFRDLAISDRFYVYLNGNDLSRGTNGGRGVISKAMFE
jgi:formylglycine-generating enzyme required for sulfatase activity